MRGRTMPSRGSFCAIQRNWCESTTGVSESECSFARIWASFVHPHRLTRPAKFPAPKMRLAQSERGPALATRGGLARLPPLPSEAAFAIAPGCDAHGRVPGWNRVRIVCAFGPWLSQNHPTRSGEREKSLVERNCGLGEHSRNRPIRPSRPSPLANPRSEKVPS